MSERLPTKMTRHNATEYWGGRGLCLQITISDDVPRPARAHDLEGFIQLDLEEAEALRDTLAVFIENARNVKPA